MAPHQPTEEINARLLARAPIRERPHEGIVMSPLPGQTCVGIINATPEDARNAPSDVPGLDEAPKGGTAVAPLVALLLTGDGDVVIGLDQLIARVGALGRAVAPASAVLPYPPTVIAKRGLILHGPDARGPACAGAPS